ncbi:MAG: type II secretion system protein GspG [Myxococcota bacterium]
MTELQTEATEILEPEIVENDTPWQSDEVAERTVHHALRDRRGMTLVEIMIVLTILAGIMVTVGVYAFDALDRAKIKDTNLKLRKVAQKVQEYYAFKSPNAMPDSLDNLVNPPGGEPPYLKDEDIRDAWGRELSFDRKGDRSFVLRSAGPDGDDGSQDDISLEE